MGTARGPPPLLNSSSRSAWNQTECLHQMCDSISCAVIAQVRRDGDHRLTLLCVIVLNDLRKLAVQTLQSAEL